MNNWRLLLLAVVVVVQPIGSFTESNLIDGRECCKRSEEARLYGHQKADERRSLDVNPEDRLTTDEERRLRSLHGIREERHYETIRSRMLTRSEILGRSERRNSPVYRLTREQERRGSLARTRETHKYQNRNRDVSRNILGQNERDSRGSKNRDTMDATRTVFTVSRDVRDTRSVEHESANTMSRLPIRISRSIEEHRVSPTRDTTILKREQEGIARDSRLSTPVRFDSRKQFDDNRERRIFDRRNQEYSNEFKRSRFMGARFNEVRAVRALRSAEQSERNNRESRAVRVELMDKISFIRSNSENSAEKLRQSRDINTRLDRASTNIRYNKRIDESKQQRDENRRSMDSLMNTEERRLSPMQERASRFLGIMMTTTNEERSEPQSLSMNRPSNTLARTLEKNTHAARIRAVRSERLDTLSRQERRNHRISRDRTTKSRRTVNRMDFTESSESQRQQREVRDDEQRQESHRSSVARRNVRGSGSEEQRQVSRLSRDRTISALREVRNTERVQESRQTLRETPDERMQQRENGQLSKGKISILRAVRDNTEQEGDRKSSERRQRDYLSNNIISAIRADREFRGSTEQVQESRRVLSPSRKEINFRKLDSRTLQNARDHERSNLRRQVLQRSMERARITRSISAERRNDARETLRVSRSVEASKIHKDTRTIDEDKRIQTRDQDRSIEQRMTRKVVIPQRLNARKSSRAESFRVERTVRNREVEERGDHDRTQSTTVQQVTRNVNQPSQRRESRRSSMPASIRLERFVRSRAEVKENVRREMQREERDDGRILSNHQSNERVSAERRQNRASSKDYRKAQITRNRGVVRTERTLAERGQENRVANRDFRIAREARITEVRSERVLSERRPENHDLRNIREEISMDNRHDTRLRRDATRDPKDRYLQRQSRDATGRLNERSRIVIVLAAAQNERKERNNERQIRFDRSMEAGDARRESRSDTRGNKYLTTGRIDGMESHLNDGKREETSFRNINAVTFQNSLVQDSDDLVSNWQMVFYTLQAVYLCGLLIQMLTENGNRSKTRSFKLWSSPKNLIKVD